EEGARIRYAAIGGLHPAIARVLVATGADAESEMQPFSLAGIERVPTATLADEAFATLGQRLLAEAGLAADIEGLQVFERLVLDTPSEEEDEIAYWTAVMQLAAVAGEVLRASFGGRWVDDKNNMADIPFVFEVVLGEKHQLFNAAGKAMKFLAHGE